MLDSLLSLDQRIFLFINYTLANPVTDAVMPLITSDKILRVVYGLAMILLLWKGNAPQRWLVLFSALTLLLTDQVAANFLKDMIGRLRPCHHFDPSQINLLVHCGGGKAMPSAHAANAFGQAVLWSWFEPKARVYLYIYAGLIAISRVFVGVHYPGDIIAGSIVGSLIAIAVGGCFVLFWKKVLNREHTDEL